jgi:hypothetical protein
MNAIDPIGLTEELENLRSDRLLVKSFGAKMAIAEVINNIEDLLSKEKRRTETKLGVIQQGKISLDIPIAMRTWKNSSYELEIHHDTLYLMERKKAFDKHRDSNGKEFHWHSYAWIPNGNKFTKLCVSMLGGDSYGDRFFVSATHYKHPADEYSYMETRIQPNSFQYRLYIECILQEVTGWTLKSLKKR